MEDPKSQGSEQARAKLPLIAAEAQAGYSSVINRHGKPLSASVACLAAQLRVQYRLKLPDAV